MFDNKRNRGRNAPILYGVKGQEYTGVLMTNRFSEEGREILLQNKELQPKEYFVYFKAGILQDCGKRSGIPRKAVCICTPKNYMLISSFSLAA